MNLERRLQNLEARQRAAATCDLPEWGKLGAVAYLDPSGAVRWVGGEPPMSADEWRRTFGDQS